MEQWHHDSRSRLDQELYGQLQSLLREPNLLLHGARSLSAWVLRRWLRLYHRLTIVGTENLPRDRSFVMIANHASHLDALCLLAALPFRRLRRAHSAAAKDYFYASARLSLLAEVVVNSLPFERRFAPWRSLRLCSHLLQHQDSILILFPEGTRCGGVEPGEFKPGIALLAAGRDLPVVPCHLAGTHAALPSGAWCPRPKAVRLTIGTPRSYPHLPATRESVRKICRELRDAVTALGKQRRALEVP